MGVGVGDRPAFRLFNPKSWGMDRPKVERRSSSAQLGQPPLVLLSESSVPHKKSDSNGKLRTCSRLKVEPESKTRKPLRKATSSYNIRESEYMISVPQNC
jgi:hypothetical protein